MVFLATSAVGDGNGKVLRGRPMQIGDGTIIEVCEGGYRRRLGVAELRERGYRPAGARYPRGEYRPRMR